MVPQSAGGVKIYRCVSFPDQWEGVKRILSGPLADTSVVHFQGLWWAFSLWESWGKGMWMLHIYYAKDLLGPWEATAHNCMPNSTKAYTCVGGAVEPHKRGSLGVRPGGRMFVEDGKLYRVAQDSARLYGDGVHLYEVTHLSIDQPVQEQVVMSFENNFRAPENVESWNLNRFHHADLHKVRRHACIMKQLFFVFNSPISTHVAVLYCQVPDRGGGVRWVMLIDGDYNKGRRVFGRNFSHDRCADVRRGAGA